jgi:CrcB protein
MGHSLVQVALGGAVGATLRYVLGIGVVRLLGRTDFPVAILAANVLGSFLIGLVVVLAARYSLTHLSPLIVTGLLGGFTTFSSFSLEAVLLWERGAALQAALYVCLSVGLSIGAFVAALALARAWL